MAAGTSASTAMLLSESIVKVLMATSRSLCFEQKQAKCLIWRRCGNPSGVKNSMRRGQQIRTDGEGPTHRSNRWRLAACRRSRSRAALGDRREDHAEAFSDGTGLLRPIKANAQVARACSSWRHRVKLPAGDTFFWMKTRRGWRETSRLRTRGTRRQSAVPDRRGARHC